MWAALLLEVHMPNPGREVRRLACPQGACSVGDIGSLSDSDTRPRWHLSLMVVSLRRLSVTWCTGVQPA